MGYSADVVRRARARLAQAKEERDSENRQHLAIAYEQVPRIREIDRQLRVTMAKAAQAAFLSGSDGQDALAKIREENKELQQERENLVKAHFEEGFLDETPICTICGGTGYVGSTMCECLQELCRQEQKRDVSILSGTRALYVRMMLYMASPRFSAQSGITWQQAADAAKDFLADYGDNYRLETRTNGGVAAYNNAWLLNSYADKNPEVIFFRNDVAIGWSGISTDTPVGEGGQGGLCPSQNLVDMYDMEDGSAPFTQYDATGAPVYVNGKPSVNTESGYTDQNMWKNRDPRLAASVLYQGSEWNGRAINVIYGQSDNPIGNQNVTPTGYYVRKYIPETILSSNHSGTAKRLWRIFTYSEILLSYAEALNEADYAGNKSLVCNLLDQIRHRGGIIGNVANRADLNSQTAMRNFIHKERTIELAFEEHRWWDVRRWNVAGEALGRDIYGVDVAADGTITRKVAQQRKWQDKFYLYPIPEAEVWKIGQDFQNEGWKE